MTTTGMSCQSGRPRSSSRNSNPSIFGIIRSRMITSGRGGERIDRDVAVLRFGHLPADRLERLAHAAADHLVVVDQKRRVPRSSRRCRSASRRACRGRPASPGSPPRPAHSRGSSGPRSTSAPPEWLASAGSPLIAASTVQPSRSGIMMSSVTAAGRSSRTSRSPSWPPRAATTAKPARSRCRTHKLAHGRIVVHDQDQRLFRFLGDRMSGLWTRLRASLARQRLLALHDPRQADGEGRALAGLAFDRDVAAHHAGRNAG